MRVIDEYLAVRTLGGDGPDELPDDNLALSAFRHWRLLQRVHAPSGGQLWFGTERNVGQSLARVAGDLGIDIHVISP